MMFSPVSCSATPLLYEMVMSENNSVFSFVWIAALGAKYTGRVEMLFGNS